MTTLIDGVLRLVDLDVLTGVGRQLELEADPSGTGVFLRAVPPSGRQRHEITLGAPVELERFLACHRYEPFWMKPAAGTSVAAVPVETQSLLIRRADRRVVVIIPLCDGVLRSSVEGAGEQLRLVVETGDAHQPAAAALSLFIAITDDLYVTLPRAAAAVAARLGTRRRIDKTLPAFVDHFGWCTWDAFYQDVSAEKVRAGLESFAAIGVRPRVLILDDGWQCEAEAPTGERRLTALAANAKFSGSLKPLVALAKEQHGIDTVLVWHAVIGYWGGVDGDALPAYHVRDVARRSSKGIAQHSPWLSELWGHLVGVVPGEYIGQFYADYHHWLANEGIDGVKVDNQAVLETVADGSGGRVAFTAAYRQGLESSVGKHFAGRLINCMSCATETWYQSHDSNLIRTSTDFWPNKPESHGLHLFTNAQVCVWFSEFLHADWDMFQSGHALGAYHAAGRAVSGAPVYVSDKPGTHDAEVLRKLVLSDGSALRCADLGRPTLDCLFHDPTHEAVLLKIFNRTAHGWVVGAFNARYHADERARLAVAGKVSPADVPGLTGDDFIGYGHQSGMLMRLDREGRVSLTLGEGSFEVVSIVPVIAGCAVVGLADRFVPHAALTEVTRSAQAVHATVRDGGRFLVWCDHAPASVHVDGQAVPVVYDASSCALTVGLALGGPHAVQLRW